MIILPTEKRFNWHNPPFILCLLIFLNVFIFFFYQSGDEEKFEEAIGLYLDAGLLKQEWKSYREHLKQSGKTAEIKDLAEAYQADYDDYVAYAILADKKFTTSMESKARALYGEDEYESLLEIRHQAVEKLLSTSTLRFGLVPNDISVISPISSQFLHGDFMHLFGNMFFLVICGFAVEAAIGHGRFLLFYLLSGLAGGFAHAALDFSSSQPLIGASGAISGVMAMYLWIFRLKKIEFFYWFYVFVGYVRLPALMILPLYIGQELFQYFMDKDSNVAFMAHAGGFVAASLLMGGLLLWKPHTLDDDYIEEDHSVDPYQQKLAGVYQAMETGQFPLALKRLQDITAEYKETFGLSLLHYQLLKMHRTEEQQQAVKKVLAHNKVNPAELRRQQQVWIENKELHNTFDDNELARIGMRFSALDDLASAENIFTLLKEKGSHIDMMGVFARKLAINFEQLRHKEKASHYTRLADAFLQGEKP